MKEVKKKLQIINRACPILFPPTCEYEINLVNKKLPLFSFWKMERFVLAGADSPGPEAEIGADPPGK